MMRLRLKLSFLGLLLLTQPTQSSRPLSELYTVGVTRVALGTVNGVTTELNYPKQSVCQLFHLESLLRKSAHLTVLDPDTSSLRKMVPLLLSLKGPDASVISMDEHTRAKRYEEEILRDFFHAQYHGFNFTTLSTLSGDGKIIIPVHFWPGKMTIPYAKKVLDSLKMDNVIFLHLNDSVLRTPQTSSQWSVNKWHWSQDLPWTQRTPVPTRDANGPRLSIYTGGNMMFDGVLTHSDMRVPGSEVLAPIIFNMTRWIEKPLNQPSLTHNIAGESDIPTTFKSRNPDNQNYHSSRFEVGDAKGVVYEASPNAWSVYATGAFSYNFPKAIQKKQ